MEGLLFVHIKFLVQSIHQKDIDEDECNEDVDGALLSKPEPQGSEFLFKQDSRAIRDEKPYPEQRQHIDEVPLPVG